MHKDVSAVEPAGRRKESTKSTTSQTSLPSGSRLNTTETHTKSGLSFACELLEQIHRNVAVLFTESPQTRPYSRERAEVAYLHCWCCG